MLPHYPPHFFEELIAKLEDVAKVAFGNDFQAEEMLWWGSLDLSRHQARIWLLQKKQLPVFWGSCYGRGKIWPRRCGKILHSI